MIKCEDIFKSFDTQVVLKSFSYQFNDKGFYLLFGESGSGKTTFLNILSGFLNFDSGVIEINGTEFKEKVDKNLIQKDFDYITQDTFFVDFLTVKDNLKLVCDNDLKIKSVLDKFGLCEKAQQYPQNLSGGEKQRLAIARSLLGNKKILFLDEPTASLDNDNKEMVFKVLSEIKKDVLVICSSHDSAAKKYADEIINFEKVHETCESKTDKKVMLKKEKPVSFFLKKWFASKRRNKKASILFGIFMILAICMCSLADTPQNKYDSNIEYLYKVNMCKVTTHEETDIYDKLCETEGIKEVVINYESCVPDGVFDSDSSIQSSSDYETSVYTLPFNEDAFKLSDKIKYGTYFTDTNQIILTYDMAISLMPENPERLIGQTFTKKFYFIGNVDFEIVGIFDKLNDVEKMYFQAMEMYNQETYFVNSRFTEQYVDNKDFYSYGLRGYTLYFENYSDMKNFYNNNYEKFEEENITLEMGKISGKTLGLFNTMFNMFLPLSVFIAFFTILFYVNLIKTEIAYNNKFISVFDYAGYPVKKVVNSFIGLNLLYLFLICMISAALAFVITYIINFINYKYVFIEFQIFTYNIYILGGFIVCILLVSAISMNVILRRLKFSSWYENIVSQRDLI